MGGPPPDGTQGIPLDEAPVSEPGKIEFFTKTVFLTIQVEIGEVWRFANFQPIWSYMASKSPLFDIFR